MSPLLRTRFSSKNRKNRAIVAAQPAPLVDSVRLAERAIEYAENADAPNTRRAYAYQWQKFEQWCKAHLLCPLPAVPGTLALYLTDRADQGAKVATLDQALVAIGRKHDENKLFAPHRSIEVKLVWKGIRRRLKTAQRKATPISLDALRRMSQASPDTPAGARDNALALVGFAGALRRQELVDLDVPDAAFTDDGLLLTLRQSKTDQEGRSEAIAIPYGADELTCPVRALHVWLEKSGITEGAIFRGVHRSGRVSGMRLAGRDIPRILQRAAQRAGIIIERLSGHSLRAGLGTTAAKQGKRLEVIQKHMRHKRLDQTLAYVRQANAFDPDDNAASGIGL